MRAARQACAGHRGWGVGGDPGPSLRRECSHRSDRRISAGHVPGSARGPGEAHEASAHTVSAQPGCRVTTPRPLPVGPRARALLAPTRPPMLHNGAAGVCRCAHAAARTHAPCGVLVFGMTQCGQLRAVKS